MMIFQKVGQASGLSEETSRRLVLHGFALAFVFLTACATPPLRPFPPTHPASPEAPEASVPPRSPSLAPDAATQRTSDLLAAAEKSQPAAMPEMQGGHEHEGH